MAVAINTQRTADRTSIAGVPEYSDICMWLESSRNQAAAERELYGDEKGVADFKQAGCLFCNGQNRGCRRYFALSTLGL